jgi:hypothetical protein
MFHKELRTPKCSQLALKSAVKELKTHTHVEVRTTEGQRGVFTVESLRNQLAQNLLQCVKRTLMKRKPTFAIGTK